MKPEIEVKFLAVDHAALRKKLESLGAQCEQPMRLMRRKNYDFADRHLEREREAWVRLRDEGDRITMSYKQEDELSVDGTSEICITVDDFVAADQFLTALGLVPKSYQETRRETWRLNNCEVVLDEWPWVKPIVEIEGPTEKDVQQAAEQIGLDWAKASFGSALTIYQAEYEVASEQVHRHPVITFDAEVPTEWVRKTSS